MQIVLTGTITLTTTTISFTSNVNMNNKNLSNVNLLNISGSTDSTSTSTGSLVISGGVGIGGNLYASNVYATTYNTTSDYRIKSNVHTLDKTLYNVDKINPIIYTNNKTNNTDIGVIAHELQNIYPFLVNGEKDGEKLQSVNYIGLIGILINEIKELKERINKL